MLGLVLVTTAGPARRSSSRFAQSKLANGLTIIVHEDHLLPEVATNIIYRVGSKNEQPGRTGFAHLFEHLMFMGTQRAPTKAFDEWMEAAGGSNNAWTSADCTDYYETGPSHALAALPVARGGSPRDAGPRDRLDRSSTCSATSCATSAARRSRTAPTARSSCACPSSCIPKAHPYHHPVIGSHADLEAASVDDVKSFFAQHYVPANASLVVAGDFKRRRGEGPRRALLRIASRHAGRHRAQAGRACCRYPSSTRWCARPSKTTWR